jgi:hypothetical protein
LRTNAFRAWSDGSQCLGSPSSRNPFSIGFRHGDNFGNNSWQPPSPATPLTGSASFTSKIKTAIQAIKDRDQAFNTLATVVNGLTNAVNSGNPQDILKIFNQ